MSKLDREVAQITGQTSDGKLPLYGHTSESTAYLVDDYPYGFTTRTKIRFWLESKKGKGWRFVSQTLNPKTQCWNKPKASTYTDWGAAMYIDNKGHVEWTGVGQYSDEKAILSFVKSFPGADMSVLRQVVPAKMKYLNAVIGGKAVWTINGVPESPERQAATIASAKKDLEAWHEISAWLDQAKH